jgi:DNA topoisomerase IV subunit A (EC 5.99.1.3)
MVKVRAKINKIDNKTLSIAEVPFGKTVPGVCDSIVKASEKGIQDPESGRSYF